MVDQSGPQLALFKANVLMEVSEMARLISIRALAGPAVVALAVASAATVTFAGGQTPTKPRITTNARPKAPAVGAGPVATVIQMFKVGISEERILRNIDRDGLHADLSTADQVALRTAGATERVMDAIERVTPVTTPSAGPVVTLVSTDAPVPPPPTPRPSKPLPTMGIYEFDWAALQTPVDRVFGTTAQIGNSIRASMTSRLLKDRKVRIVEQAKIDDVLRTQNTTNSNRYAPETAAKIGKLAGANVMLMGDITSFGWEVKEKSGLLGGFLKVFTIVNFWKVDHMARIVLNYRIVNTNTGEVIDAGEARGESIRTSKSFGVAGSGGGAAGGGGTGTAYSQVAETLVGEAVMNACDKVAIAINERAAEFVGAASSLEARVAVIKGGTLTINAGKNQKVALQELFEVLQITGEVKDPVTGEIIDMTVEPLGDMIVTAVRERTSDGTYTGKAISPKAVEAGILVRRRS